MQNVKIFETQITGKVKPMHAVNNGPIYKFAADQRITNIDAFKEAGIPYARNHDASFNSTYGGEHTVDVRAIFPDFDADPYDENSYDFACTDEYLKVIDFAGVKTFYRLGSKIEHGVKKYGTLPPKDFKKWAIICEHIIRHYTEGWANGFHYDIEYWEIWNEPDLDSDDSTHKRTWGGTKSQFFEFYDIAARHLKQCFPEKKIGGPALAWDKAWAEDFLKQLKAPLDFFSWHIYSKDVELVIDRILMYREWLDKYGFTETESILNEWNYVAGWEGDDWLYSLKMIKGLKGASFTAAVMCTSQYKPLDMLMYYDARIDTNFNGLWDRLYDRLPTYYTFLAFKALADLGTSVEVEKDKYSLYTIAATNGEEQAIMISAFDSAPATDSVTFKLCLTGAGETAEYYLLDSGHSLECVKTEPVSNSQTITMEQNSVMLIKIK